MLMDVVDSYLKIRRVAGFELKGPDYLLRSFARFSDQKGYDHVNTEVAIEWARQAPSKKQRIRRLSTVIILANDVRAEDPRHEVPPRGVFGPRQGRQRPYIYSTAEINDLLRTACQLGPSDSLRPHTYSTLFALLVTTGLRISEALALVFDDVKDDGLIIRKTKFKKSRLVPMHDTTRAGLERYLALRRDVVALDDHLFISLRQRVLDRSAVTWTFRSILKDMGLNPPPNGRRPRIHDLRHTFACRALESCPPGRENVDRHLRALSTYMGHVRISDTDWYLESTPELMRNIALTCEHFFPGGRS